MTNIYNNDTQTNPDANALKPTNSVLIESAPTDVMSIPDSVTEQVALGNNNSGETFSLRPEYKPKSIRSYVIRAGRMTLGQKKAFLSYWPNYGVSLYDGTFDATAHFGRTAPQVLEIGFGMGASLLTMATQEPEKDFIGIEVHPPGVGHLINEAGAIGIANLRVYMADAIDVLDDCIADNSIDRLQLYFPDPWHKKKHNKRRILQPEFAQKVLRKLKPGGIFHLATDWQDYADQMMEVMSAAEGYVNCAGQYKFSPCPSYRPNTKFEKRGEDLGHGVWDLLFEK